MNACLSQFAVQLRGREPGLMVHTLSGAASALPPSPAPLRDADLAALPPQVLLDWRRKGFVVPDRQAERDALWMDYFRGRLVRAMLRLTIVPSYACNCACPDCYQAGYDQHACLSPELQRALLGFAGRLLRERHVRRLMLWLYGGEPFAQADVGGRLVGALREACARQGTQCLVYAATNGTLLAHPRSAALLRAVDVFYVSLAQGRAAHAAERPFRGGRSSFDACLGGLARLAAADKTIHLRVNVSRVETLADDFAATQAELLRIFGGRPYPRLRFEFRPLLPACHSASAPTCVDAPAVPFSSELQQALRRITAASPWPASDYMRPAGGGLPLLRGACGGVEMCDYAKGEAFLVPPDGSLYLCNHLKNDARFRIGDLRDPDAALRHPLYLRLLNSCAFDDDACRECAYLPWCLRECPVTTFDRGGAYHHEGCVQEQERRLLRWVDTECAAARGKGAA